MNDGAESRVTNKKPTGTKAEYLYTRKYDLVSSDRDTLSSNCLP